MNRVLLDNNFTKTAAMGCNTFIERCHTLKYRMTRRKAIESHDTTTALNRYLTTWHLTFMGVGATVGVGIYVLVGVAAKDYAGPGMLISFLLAGVVTLLNALCFAEFGSRIPKTGVAYTYVYDSMCEILAFIVGWLMLLGYLSSGAIVCRAWSGYFDSLFGGAIHNMTLNLLGTIDFGPPFSNTYDIAACVFQLVAVLIVSLGIHASAKVNFVLSSVSIGVLLFVTIMGIVYGDIDNIINKDHGGFLPFGFNGVIVGTSACFYAFQGFDVICMSAEESKTPHWSIPRAILFELIIVTLIYAGSSFSLILLTPVHMIDTKAPLPYAFENHENLHWAKYVVTIGPVLGISNLILLNLFSASRHIYCMANDGLFFKMFAVVNKKAQVPLTAVIAVGLVNAVGGLLLDMANLVQFSVIALFLINIVISANVIIVRSRGSTQERDADSEKKYMRQSRTGCLCKIMDTISVECLTFAIVVLALQFGLLIQHSSVFSTKPNTLALCAIVIVVSLMVGISVIIKQKMKPYAGDGFRVPFVPFLPVLIIMMNSMFLLYATDLHGFISISILTIIGIFLYLLLNLTSGNLRPSDNQMKEEIELMLPEDN